MENSAIVVAKNEATNKRKSDAMADKILDLKFDSNYNALLDNQEKKKRCKTTTDNSRRRPKTIVPKENMRQWRLPTPALAPAPAPALAPAMTPAPIASGRQIFHSVITTPLFLEAEIQYALPYFNDEVSSFLQYERNRMYDISKMYPYQSLTQECRIIDSILKARINYPTDSSDRIQIMFEKSFENQGIIKQANSIERQSYWNCLLDWSIHVLPLGQRIHDLQFNAPAPRQLPAQVPAYQLLPQYPPLSAVPASPQVFVNSRMYNNVSYNRNYQTNNPGPYQGPSTYEGILNTNFNNGNLLAINTAQFGSPSTYGHRISNNYYNNQPINIAGHSTYGYEISNNNFNNGNIPATGTAHNQRPTSGVSNDNSSNDTSQTIGPAQFEQTPMNVEEQFEQSAQIQRPADEISRNDSNNDISPTIDLPNLEEAPVNVGEPFEQPTPLELDTEVPERLEVLPENNTEEFDDKKFVLLLKKWNDEHVRVNRKLVYIGEGKDWD